MLKIPDWFLEQYGRREAQRLWGIMLDRHRLVTFNSGNEYPKQVEFAKQVLDGDSKIHFAIAGNRWGKTEVGAAICASFVTGIVPWSLGGTGFEDLSSIPPVRNVWIVSLDFPASRDIIRPKLDKYLPKDLIKEWRQADQMYVMKNGAIIGLKSADSGREKFQGVSKDLIWMDEEPPEEIFDECMARTIDCAGKMVCTMTPLNGLSWSFDRIWEQRDKDPDIFVTHGEMSDNPYLPRAEIARVQKQWKDPAIRKARMSGLYTLIRGSQVFDPESLMDLMGDILEPIRVDRSQGLHVWEEPDPDVQYAIGIDTGKGKPKGDFSAAVVLDCHNRNVVALLRCRKDAEVFAGFVDEIGRNYNNALVVPERQDHGIVTIKTLQRLGYPRIYRKRSLGRISTGNRTEYGFSTDTMGKPLLVSLLKNMVDEKSVEIPSKIILDEMGAFIWYGDKIPNDKDRHKVIGKCGAMAGKNDDTVIALALALVGAESIHQTSRRPSPVRPTTVYQRRTRKFRGNMLVNPDPRYFGNEIRRWG